MHDATGAWSTAQHEGGEHIRTWTAGDFRLDLWDTGRADRLGKSILRYRLIDREPWGEVFAGADFACSPLHAVDSDATVAAVLGFLSLRRGDTDADYFADYTAKQLAWRDERAEELALLALELAEGGR